MNEPRDRLDDELDRALTTYSGVSEPIRLRARLLEHGRLRSRPRTWLVYAGVGAASVAMLCVWFVHGPGVARAPQKKAAAVIERSISTPVRTAVAEPLVKMVAKHRRQVKAVAGPEIKQAQFPMAVPLTKEEKDWLSMVGKFQFKNTPDKPLSIAELEVVPLKDRNTEETK